MGWTFGVADSEKAHVTDRETFWQLFADSNVSTAEDCIIISIYFYLQLEHGCIMRRVARNVLLSQ